MTLAARAETLGDAIRQGTTAYADCHLVVVSAERPRAGTLGELGVEATGVAAWLQSSWFFATAPT